MIIKKQLKNNLKIRGFKPPPLIYQSKIQERRLIKTHYIKKKTPTWKKILTWRKDSNQDIKGHQHGKEIFFYFFQGGTSAYSCPRSPPPFVRHPSPLTFTLRTKFKAVSTSVKDGPPATRPPASLLCY